MGLQIIHTGGTIAMRHSPFPSKTGLEPSPEFPKKLLVKIPETGFNEISEFALFQNIPNPFNPTTNIKVIINKSNFVKIIVYNHLGEEVKVLSDKYLKSGEYTFNFDGSSLPSGVYYYKVYTGNYSETKKMILIR